MDKLFILAVSTSPDTRGQIAKVLSHIESVQFEGISLDIARARQLYRAKSPEIIIVDLMSKPEEGLSFIQSLVTSDPDRPCLVFALHKDLDAPTMLQAMQSGVKEFIAFNEPRALENALNKHLMLYKRFTAPPVKKTRGKLISVFAPKGGAGASTVAFNTAFEIHRATDQSVAFFEPDQSFSNVRMMLNLAPEFCLGDLVKYKAGTLDEQLLKKLVVHHESGIDFLVCCKNVLDDNEMVPVPLMNNVLEYLVNRYEYVIVDLPSQALDAYHQAVVERSDLVLLVSGMDIPAVYRTMQYLELVKNYLDTERVKLVLNRHDLPGAYGLSNKNLEKEFGHPVYSRLPDNWPLNLQANSLGCPLSMVEENADLVREFRKMASNITGVQARSSSSGKGFSLLNKFTGLKIQTSLNLFSKDGMINAPSKT